MKQNIQLYILQDVVMYFKFKKYITLDLNCKDNQKQKKKTKMNQEIMNVKRNEMSKLIADRCGIIDDISDFELNETPHLHGICNPDIIVEILDSYPHVNIIDKRAYIDFDRCKKYKFRYGETALAYAVRKSMVDAAKILIERGANVNIEFFSSSGKDSAKLNPTFDYYTPLHVVTNKSLAELLISKGLSPNVVTKSGKTPLFTVNNVEVAKVLIEHGANINHVDNLGDSVLHTHFICRNICNYLIKECHLDPNVRNSKMETPLHYVMTRNTIKCLLENGADINAVDIEGHTSLFGAIHNETDEILQCLMEYGPDISIKNKKGQTIAEYVNEVYPLDSDSEIEIMDHCQIMDLLLMTPDQARKLPRTQTDGTIRRFETDVFHWC